MLPTFALLLSLALSPAPSSAVAEDVELKFAWPGEGEVKVTERREKRGKPTELSYRVAWKTDAETGNLVLETSDVAVATVRGLPTTGDEPHEYALANGAILAAIPDVVVGPDGKFRKVGDVQKAINAAKRIAWDLKVRGRDAEKRLETVRKRVLFELKQAPLADRIAADEERKWNAWAQAWLGFAAPVGKTVEEVTGDLDTRQVKTIRRCLRRASEGGMDVAEVSIVRVETGATLRDEARARMQARQVRFRTQETIKAATRRIEITGTFEIDTLRPLVVEMTDTLEVVSPERPAPVVDTVKWAYVFEWPAAAPAEGEGD